MGDYIPTPELQTLADLRLQQRLRLGEGAGAGRGVSVPGCRHPWAFSPPEACTEVLATREPPTGAVLQEHTGREGLTAQGGGEGLLSGAARSQIPGRAQHTMAGEPSTPGLPGPGPQLAAVT